MRLENILALTYGQLVNKPFVSEFTNIVFNAKDIKRGDLFFAFDEDAKEEAIANGAYGVLFMKPTQISDSEIAWIKVDDIVDAYKRVLRFRLIDKNIAVYESNEIILKLAMQIVTDSSFNVVDNDIVSMSKKLWNLEDNSTLLFSSSTCDRELFTDIKKLKARNKNSITIMEKTLFETSFIYDNKFYERQPISPFFIPYLDILLHLLKFKEIKFRLKTFTHIEHFEPIFINKNFEKKEFGASDRVLIFESNTNLIDAEILFLKEYASWGNHIYILPSYMLELPRAKSYRNNENIFSYDNSNEIVDILRETHFNFALLVGVDQTILNRPLFRHKQLTLDF